MDNQSQPLSYPFFLLPISLSLLFSFLSFLVWRLWTESGSSLFALETNDRTTKPTAIDVAILFHTLFHTAELITSNCLSPAQSPTGIACQRRLPWPRLWHPSSPGCLRLANQVFCSRFSVVCCCFVSSASLPPPKLSVFKVLKLGTV